MVVIRSLFVPLGGKDIAFCAHMNRFSGSGASNEIRKNIDLS
jgi:hypothetical protein